jgi:predicted DNA-binding protein with PD1-like motif
MTHPGPFNPVRIHSCTTPGARHFRLRLAPGETLFDSLVRPLAGVGVECASITLLGGAFEFLQYCTAPPDPRRAAVIAYTAPIVSGATWMVFGNATIAKGLDRAPLVHCHAALRTGAGDIRGGHVIAHTAVVGDAPLVALVTALEGIELQLQFDAETNIPLIRPAGASEGAVQ